MKTKNRTKLLSFILCIALTAAMALFTTGCNGSTGTPSSFGASGGQPSEGSPADGSTPGSDAESQQKDVTVLGEGSTKFNFTVVDREGGVTAFEIHTDKETVGDALLELKLIAGEEGQYGLYVKTVNGITVDYDKDGAYWAFYVNDEYAAAGVDSTKITEGAVYSFKVE